jgi:hypothetical protein
VEPEGLAVRSNDEKGLRCAERTGSVRIFGLCLLVAVCVGIGGRSPALAAPPGSYKETCVSISTNGNWLYAKCEDVNGDWHPSQLDTSRCPNGLIANNNSVLVCGRGGHGISNSLPRGSWRASCQDASKTGGVLYAQCDNGSGVWHSTSLNLDTCPGRIVGNSGGNLVCTSGAGGGAGSGGSLPGGTWQSTCRNGYVQGSIFYAQCNTGEGPSWHSSSLNLNNCPSRRVGNSAGNLVCQGSTGGSNGGYNPGTLPPGSWRTTCRNGRLEGSMLYAECYDGAGTWRAASYDLRRCHGSLGNNHGVLYCTTGATYRRLG